MFKKFNMFPIQNIKLFKLLKLLGPAFKSLKSLILKCFPDLGSRKRTGEFKKFNKVNIFPIQNIKLFKLLKLPGPGGPGKRLGPGFKSLRS